MEIVIKDSLYNPTENRKYIQKTVRPYDGKTWYLVYLYIEGIDLPYIKAVKYSLHQDLKSQPKIVFRTPDNPNCLYSFWTFGVFTIHLEVEDYKGSKYYLMHDLEFMNDFPSNQYRVIGRDEGVPLHLVPNVPMDFNIKDGFDCEFDELRLDYAAKYDGKTIYVGFKDANGFERKTPVVLDSIGYKTIYCDPIGHQNNFGFVSFLSNDEIFAEFKVKRNELHRG